MRRNWRKSALKNCPTRSYRVRTVIGPRTSRPQWTSLLHMPTRFAPVIQAGMNGAAHYDNDETYSHQTIADMKHIDHNIVNIYLSWSDSDTKTGDHVKAVFTPSNGQPQWSTFPTSERSSVLDSRQYCCVCFQSSYVSSAFLNIKTTAECPQIWTGGTPAFTSNSNIHRGSPNRIPKHIHFYCIAQRDLKPAIPSTQRLQNNCGIRSDPLPSHPDFKLSAPSVK